MIRAKTKESRFPVELILSAIFLLLGLLVLASSAAAQGMPAGSAANTATRSAESERERRLLERIDALEARLAALEGRPASGAPAATNASTAPAAPQAAPAAGLEIIPGATFNFYFDGHYGYNFNRPVGRVNLLRAYDVTSNSFNLNQTGMVLERLPSAERRLGFRFDLMYGQATETLQGSAANEPRPQVFRPVWQAYGSYLAPLGSGLSLDFGKFASVLGYETNFAKDNFNYSRAYFFNFLPFYHYGVRARYSFNSKLSGMYALVNGAQQTEDFNGFKSQHLALTATPHKRLVWQFNYYLGQEQRDHVPLLNPGLPTLPTQPGLSTLPVLPTLRGRFHVLDTYATWYVTDKLTLALEGDYVINRVQQGAPPAVVFGGSAYANYVVNPRLALAARIEYLSDRHGLFSSASQALKETTFTASFPLADGFLMRAEWRRDFSNQPFFLTAIPGQLKKEQNTATLGLLWWFGPKQGAW